MTKLVCINYKSTEACEYPSKATRDKYEATGTPFLSGFELYKEDGIDNCMNFILSNGDRSAQRDPSKKTDYSHMIPTDALSKLRSVTIHYNNYIRGFSFFDKDGEELWKIGETTNSW